MLPDFVPLGDGRTARVFAAGHLPADFATDPGALVLYGRPAEDAADGGDPWAVALLIYRDGAGYLSQTQTFPRYSWAVSGFAERLKAHSRSLPDPDAAARIEGASS